MRYEPRYGWNHENVSIQQQSEHPSTFDIITKLVLPVVLGVNAFFVREHPYWFGLLIAGTIAASFFRPFLRWFQSFRDATHDERLAQLHIKKLRQFSKEAGDFFDTSTSRSDSLAAIVQEINNRTITLTPGGAIQIVPLGIYQQHWRFVNKRLRSELDRESFHDAVEELTGIIQGFNNHCVGTIFRIAAANLRERLLPNEKSKLNAFQQRYVSFVGAYMKCIDEFGEEFRSLPKLYAGMPLPEPL